MYDSILQFAEQLKFQPEVVNGPVQNSCGKIIFVGMGGSHLAGGLLKLYNPLIDIIEHRGYGLPEVPQEALAQSLLVVSSYSGNTEEVLDSLEHAIKTGFRPAIITSGGRLLERAREERLPYVQIPDTIVQPRVAVGVSLLALAALLDDKELMGELVSLSGTLNPRAHEEEGKHLAEALVGFVPLVYASCANEELAFNWKIKINETAKVPAFMNVFSELNHNELAAFDAHPKAPKVPFKILLIKDTKDHPRIQKRMKVMSDLLAEKQIHTVESSLSGDSRLERALQSLVTADWTAYHLALRYGVNPDTNMLIEEFKRTIGK